MITEPIGVATAQLPKPLDWELLFGNPHPIEIEIGIGKGSFLLERSKNSPDINFIGIEWAKKYWRYASDRLRRHGCTNVRTFTGEAHAFIHEYVPAHSVNIVHIYFPDPWPKRRHHKRRLIQTNFIAQIERILKINGILKIVTDHKEYFSHIYKTIENSTLSMIPFSDAELAAHQEIVGSNFEKKYRQEGREFFCLAAIKI